MNHHTLNIMTLYDNYSVSFAFKTTFSDEIIVTENQVTANDNEIESIFQNT